MTDRTDINDLLLAWRDDDVTPAEYEALVAALRTPAGRRALVEEWTFATAAREILSLAPASQDGGSPDRVVAVDDAELEALLAGRARRASRDLDRPAVLFSFRRWPARVAAAAAAVAVAASATWYTGLLPVGPTQAANPAPQPVVVATQPPSTTHPAAVPSPAAGIVARVTETSGGLEVLDAAGVATPAFAGHAVLAGQTLRTVGDEGFAAVEYPDGSRIEMSVDTVARFGDASAGGGGDAGKRVYFSAGVIRADVAPQPPGRPLVVASPQAEIRVLGTKFSVASAMPDTTRVDLESGKVELVRTSDGRLVELAAGSYALARADLEPVVVESLPRFLATPRKVLGSKWAASISAVGTGAPVVTANGRFIEYWDAGGRQEKLSVIDRLGEGGPAVFAPDGSVAAAASSKGGQVQIWDVARRREAGMIETQGHPVGTLAVAPRGAWVAVVDPKRPNVVRVLDAAGGADGLDRFTFEVDAKYAKCLAASPNGALLAVGTQSDKRVSPTVHRIELFDARTGARVGTLGGHARGVRTLVFSPDGTRLASSGDDGVLRVWDVPSLAQVAQMGGHEQSLAAVAFSADGALLAGGGGDGRVWVWDSRTGDERLVVHAGFRAVRSVAFVPDGRHLLTHTFDGPVTVWDLKRPADAPTPAPPAGDGTVRATVPGAAVPGGATIR
ncbi:MAG TPA: FecR domain-containing protein [Humisphaera sp.]